MVRFCTHSTNKLQYLSFICSVLSTDVELRQLTEISANHLFSGLVSFRWLFVLSFHRIILFRFYLYLLVFFFVFFSFYCFLVIREIIRFLQQSVVKRILTMTVVRSWCTVVIYYRAMRTDVCFCCIEHIASASPRS